MAIRKLFNRLFISIAFLSFLCVISILVICVASICYKGLGNFKINMLFSLPKAVGESGGGFANAIVGTIIICCGAMICFTPIGIIIAILLAIYKYTKISHSVNILINSLNSTPSIVIGVIAYILLVEPFKTFNAIAAMFAVGMIYLPYVVIYAQEVLTKMNILYMEQGVALGLSKFKTTFFLLLRFSKSMIIFGMLSGLARIVGESAPLLFTALGNDAIFEGLMKPISALPLLIFTYAISPFEQWRSLAWSAAFVMLVMVLILNLSLSFIGRKFERNL
ncbi:MAG: PstA family ABC transporter permease [Planctomycetota bacterium]